ncbi:hypothetical protein FisN_11Lh291 [Fistulifera solaris]|uniref:Uncharacterized protein n=1 Tax=Fistulifera solaris TaxID=1519565 RepID=A0A1Z5K0Q7_FISSO|nr:hypothetical protein FisN_11Lh291 [Fistulifera solaris]|eukprot:GAX19837.1 hypothetical protein FisN_11Lh291 [Fistulifera solaris]
MAWDKNQSTTLSSDNAHLFESESSLVASVKEEPSEVSLSYEDDFAILRAADPQVTEQFHMSMGKNRSKSPATRKLQAVELMAPFSKSMPNLEQEEGSENIAAAFVSPKPPKETLFYGSKQDVFASPASIDDNSSCNSSKEDVFSSPQPVSVGKPKNLVKNVKPAPMLTTAGSPKNKQNMKALTPRRPSVKAVANGVSPKSDSSPGTIRVPVNALKKTQTKSRSSSLKRNRQPEAPKTSKKDLKEQLLRTLLADANHQQKNVPSGSKSVSSKSVSTTLTPTEVDSIVGNVSQHHRSRTPTTNHRIKITKSDLLQKLQHDQTADGSATTTVTTSTSTKSSKSPTKQKRVIKIRKSDLEDKKKANLDDLLDKAASEWKATLRRSSMSSGTKWQTTSDDPAVREKKVEKKRPSSRSRREKRSVTDAETILSSDKSQAKRTGTAREGSELNKDTTVPTSNEEQTRDSSRNRSRRRSPRSYEMLRSVDDHASHDPSTDGHSRSRSRRTSVTQPSPARRKSLFGDFRMGERSSRSTRTSDATRRPSIMASVAKKFSSERKERSVSTPRASSPSLVKVDKAKARRSLSNPRSPRSPATTSDDNKRGTTSNPFSLHGLQKMLGFSPSSNNEKIQVESSGNPKGSLPSFPDRVESSRSEMNSKLLARIRQAGVTDAILLALSEQGLVIVERKALT